MDEDEYRALLQKLVEELFRGATRSLECGKFTLDDEDMLSSGRLSFVTGYRDLMRIADGKPGGCEAIWKTIRGTALISCIALHSVDQKAFIVRQRQSDAGKESGKARRVEAEQTWQPHALVVAIEIQAEDPDIIQTSLAKEIKSRWRLKIPCPKSQLIKAISRWQREGKLAPRKKL